MIGYDYESKMAMHNIAVFIVQRFAEKNKCSQEEALLTIMKTKTYAGLMDPETGIFLESRECVLDMAESELAGDYSKFLAV